MGGMGKTTLAQIIYNEPEIQKHFQLQLWVCVSDSFDVNSIAKSIVEASPKKNYDTDKPSLDRLQKLVSGKRYLLVLDDVWNREVQKWERLKVCLQHGGLGSAVLTTTRDKQVAEIMGAGRTYNLNVLKDNFIKEIIVARAFSSKNEKPPKLLKLVGQIVKRCRGSPLAATALGSVLRTKTSVEEWKAISSRSSICTDETGILPILKLSYNDLPAHMKQCFAFCAIFPKDYKINVEKLIQLWIANGFIPEHGGDSLETIGKHIFSELASRSFFLDIEETKEESVMERGCFPRMKKDYYSITTCKIHDLMHDIAMSVMKKECVTVMEPDQTEWLLDSARHLFVSCRETKGILNDALEKKSPVIQTLICDSVIQTSLKHQSKYSPLLALKLYLRTELFLPKPKYMHHLRYLDLSESSIEALPEDISILYNLQVLDISNCLYLERLPRQMKYMTSLRHLYTHGCPELKSMPPGLENLTKLQTLTVFVAGVPGPDCSDVGELHDLKIGGQLELRQIENVEKAESEVANLGNKKDLRELILRWTSVYDSKVLDNFEPHDGLHVLKIYRYGGECIGMLQNMVEIHLFHCKTLQFLFRCSTFFTFSKLKVFTLENLFGFEGWWEIDERQEQQTIFPVLEKLFISNCGKLVALPKAPLLQGPCAERGCTLVHSAFPALKVLKMKELESFQRWDAVKETQGEQLLFPWLEELSIMKCPKLTALPEAPLLQEPCSEGGYRLVRSTFPALKVVKMKSLERFQRWDPVEGTLFPQLEKLSVKKCPQIINLPEAPKLSVLEIEDGKQEIFHCVDRYLPSLNILILNLEYIEITSEVDCTSIVPVESKEKWNQKSPLTFMQLRCCNSFFGAGAREPSDYFLHLQELEIDRCDVLVHWPVKVFHSLVSLRKLVIRECKNLTGYTQAPLEPSPTERSQCLPGLVSLWLIDCASLVELFNVPTSLKTMYIGQCNKLQSIFGKQHDISDLVEGSSSSETIVPAAVPELPSSPMEHFCQGLEDLTLSTCGSLSAVLNLPPSLKFLQMYDCSSIQVLACQPSGLQKPEAITSISRRPMVPEPLSAAATTEREHLLPPHLERLVIHDCTGMLGGTLRLPAPLKSLEILGNSGLTSLEYLSGEHPSSLEILDLQSCSTLASLPNEPQVYSSLGFLEIRGCPAIKKLPRCLQLGSLNYKRLDAQYEVMALKPKTWNQMPRLVSERRKATREARERQ
uniref:Uncharacterized protein n=1 Tax=Hordeum vulgare subsp. vulgare TaxID=112509 RepID=M0VVV6_HORVV